MKTFDEIKQHLKKGRYTPNAIAKIMGFLIGKEMKTIDDWMLVSYGDREFLDFYDWFNEEEKEEDSGIDGNEMINQIIDDIEERAKEAKDKKLKERYQEQIDFLSLLYFVNDGDDVSFDFD